MKLTRQTSGRIAITSLFMIALGFVHLRESTTVMDSPEKESGRSGAYEALDFWSAARAYPDPDISPDRFSRAYEYSSSHIPPISSESPTSSQWKFIGPTNFSGRMISLAINPQNPNAIYAGSASGGIWRSRTGGLSGDWQRITTGFPVLGVSAIAIDPVDTNVIYMGTGEVYRYGGSYGGLVVRTTRGSYGLGILKTTNGGTTWSKSLDWTYNQQRGIEAIRINPRNRNTLLAATTEGVYRSTDAGGTWNQALPVIMARDVAINPNDTTKVLATCGNFNSAGHGVYRSTNGGQSFTQVTGLSDFTGMAVLGTYAANPMRIYLHLAESTAVVGTTWRSIDFGLTWTLINNSNSYDIQGWYARFLAVNPIDSSKIVLGTQGLWRSTNGGTTFSTITQGWADYHSFAQHPTNSNILYIVDDGGPWRSTNFGVSFTYVGNGLQTSQFYNGFSSSATDSNLALGQAQDHFGWLYTGSTTWPESGIDEAGWTAINQTNDLIMYADTRIGGELYKSTNRGNSFNSFSTGLTGGTAAWNSPFILSNSNPNFLYFGRSRIFRSTNAAATWGTTNGGLDLDGNPALSMAMSSTNTDSVYVATAPLVTRSHVFRTVNGGTSWTDITGILPNRYPLDIAVDPHNSSIVYITFGGFGVSHVFKSINAGTVWTDISGILPDVPAGAVFVDPANSSHVFVGTDIGVYLSTNSGTDWVTFNEGLPEAVLISDLNISSGHRLLRAVTHGNGVYERSIANIVTDQPPVVSDIPNQTVAPGGKFAPIRADNFVADPDNADSSITWSWSGNSNLVVTWVPNGRRIRVRSPRNWTGTETITFTATDPAGLSDSDPATFTVTATNESPLSLLPEQELSQTTSNLPAAVELHAAYPNPFNPTTTIRYDLPEDTWVSLKIYNSIGEEVKTLVNEFQRSGFKSIVWDGRNESGGKVSSGAYLYVLRAGQSVRTEKMILTK